MHATSLSGRLVRLLLRRRRDGVPPDVGAKVRLHIADSIGIALAAARGASFGECVLRAHAEGGTSGRCTVLGRGQVLPPAAAAFVNASLAHILDYDDIHDAARLHPTTVSLPAALAAAELSDAGGDALCDAVAIGNELTCRLGLMWSPAGTGPGSDWFLTQLFGYFGACLAAGIVLGLSEDETVSALGLAYMQAAGGKEAGFGVHSNARAIYPAFAAAGGLQAALLARHGIIGPATALDGAAGLFRIYLGTEPEPQAIEALLDEHAWQFRDTQLKPWPSCRLSHPYVAAALAIRDRMAEAPVERIVVHVNASAAKLCRPLEARRRPSTLQDAKYSLPFMTAFALARGAVSLENLTEDALQDPVVLELAARIEIAETLPDGPGSPPAVIELRSAGRTLRSPEPLRFEVSEAQARVKFLACLSYAGLANDAPALLERLLGFDARPVASLVRSIPHLRSAPA